VLAGAVCLAALGPAVAPRIANGASVAQKRREAARLQASIESTATKIELLNEDYLDAQVRLKKFSQKAATSTAAASQTEKDLHALRERIRAQALATYARPPASQGDALRTSEDLNELERRGAYAKNASAANFDAEDELRAALATLKERQSAASRAKAAVAAEVKILGEKQLKAAALLRQYSALEAQAQGELAVLVREAEKAAAEREAAQAQAAQKKLQAKAKAELERRRRETRQRLEHGANTGVGGAGKGNVPQVSILRRSHGEAPATAQTDTSRQSDAQLAIDAGETPAVASSPGANSAVQTALAQVGKPYVWAADGPGSFDCSGLMLFAWRAGGASLPHSSRSQFSATTRVSVSQVHPGDLLFYGSPIHHVGMYVGNGKMVEASHAGVPVRVASIFRRDLVGVGRVR
jgi:peptidoglycan DL-endopeptidase CwlO